jgi:ATP:cob(I)alamin adenosyltransferase
MFTRRGDSGETDNSRKERVSKASIHIEVEGTIDELNSFLGMALDMSGWDDIRNDIDRMQENIFRLGEHIIASANGRTIKDEDVNWLEERVNVYRKEIGKITLFVVPGGSRESSSLHIARTVSRRLERLIVLYAHEKDIPRVVLQYSNRISSLLCMMALVSNRRLNVEERIWPLRPPS